VVLRGGGQGCGFWGGGRHPGGGQNFKKDPGAFFWGKGGGGAEISSQGFEFSGNQKTAGSLSRPPIGSGPPGCSRLFFFFPLLVLNRAARRGVIGGGGRV